MNSLRKMGVILVLVLIGLAFVEIINENDEIGKDIPVLIYPTMAENRVKIAIMADIHNDGEQFRKMLDKARGNEVNMVIVAGDLTNNGSKGELIKMKEKMV